jgi:simple sugar transport system permease protein
MTEQVPGAGTVEQAPGGEGRRGGTLGRVAGSFLQLRWASILIVAVALGVYFSFASASFLTVNNMLVLASFLSATAIIAAGEVMLMICGEIDLSVGFVYALAPFIMYFTYTQLGFPLWLGLLAGLAIAALIGLVNGVVTVVLRVPSFVTTLGTAFVLSGLALTFLSFPVQTPGPGSRFAEVAGHNQVWELAWALGVVLVVQAGLSYTRWGLYTISVGGNQLGAAEAGVAVNRIKIANFMVCSFLGGLAGTLEVFRTTSIDATAGGFDKMFQAVAAAVIGGTALAGGSGTVVGALLGALVLSTLNDGFTLIGIEAKTFDIILGAAILVAMIVNVSLQRRRQQGAV